MLFHINEVALRALSIYSRVGSQEPLILLLLREIAFGCNGKKILFFTGADNPMNQSTVAQKCHGNYNLLTAVSICSRQFQFCSRQFQFAHGSFNFAHGSFNFAHDEVIVDFS